MSENNGFETVLKWVVVVILALAALKVLTMVLGIAFVLGGFLLFKVLPLVLVVWGGYKLFQWLGGRSSSAAAGDL
jgi:hypothetical protein